jgi:hypothetical protein
MQTPARRATPATDQVNNSAPNTTRRWEQENDLHLRVLLLIAGELRCKEGQNVLKEPGCEMAVGLPAPQPRLRVFQMPFSFPRCHSRLWPSSCARPAPTPSPPPRSPWPTGSSRPEAQQILQPARPCSPWGSFG